MSRNGREFYGEEVCGKLQEGKEIALKRVHGRIEESWTIGEESVVPFWAGKELRWAIV